MPICTALIAAALLSAPAGQTPSDAQPSDASPGKKVATFAMQHADNPELVADKALELLKGKTKPIAPVQEENKVAIWPAPQGQGAQAPQGQAAAQDAQAPQSQAVQGPEVRTGEQGPQDVFLYPQGNAPMIKKVSGEDLAKQTPGQAFSEFGQGAWSSDD